MLLNTEGLIIREQNTGEDDRMITLLTRDLGVVRAFANGARRMKNKNRSATSLFTYSRLTLYKGRDKYILNEAEPLEVFFELRQNIEWLALGQYFCELCLCLAPQEDEAEAFLRLALNCLHLLASGKRSPAQLKAIFELRILGLSGYMPDLTACAGCGVFEGDPLYLLPRSGVLTCPDCKPQGEEALPLSPSVLAAMRHILYSDAGKIFSFSLPDEQMKSLSSVVERALIVQVDRSFSTLEFYRAVAL